VSNSDGHQWAVPLTAYGQILLALDSARQTVIGALSDSPKVEMRTYPHPAATVTIAWRCSPAAGQSPERGGHRAEIRSLRVTGGTPTALDLQAFDDQF